SATEEQLLVATVAEIVNAAVLLKSPHYVDDADPVAKPRHAWPKTTNAAHNEGHLPSCRRGAVERIDQPRVREPAHLKDQVPLLTRLDGRDLSLDATEKLLAQ